MRLDTETEVGDMALYRCGGGGDDITSATIVSESKGSYL